LARRYEIWLPTLRGWLLLVLLLAALGVMTARGLYPFLAVNEPVGARVLVVEGWMGPEELDQALAAFRAGGYERIVTTGGPAPWWLPAPRPSHAQLAAEYLKRHGLAEATVTAVPTVHLADERTFQSALAVRDWSRSSGLRLEALDVFSEGTHARRSRLLYRLAFGPEVRVGVIAARAADYDPGHWWRTSVGSRDVLDQAIGYLWVKLFFRPERFADL
jgi:DUF218 domain